MDGGKIQSSGEFDGEPDGCSINSMDSVTDECPENDDDPAELSMEMKDMEPNSRSDPTGKQFDRKDVPGESESDVAECEGNADNGQVMGLNIDERSDNENGDAVLQENLCATEQLDENTKECVITDTVLNEKQVSILDSTVFSTSSRNANEVNRIHAIVDENRKGTEPSQNDDACETIHFTTENTTLDVISDKIMEQLKTATPLNGENTDNVENKTVFSDVEMGACGNFVHLIDREEKTEFDLSAQNLDELLQQTDSENSSSIIDKCISNENIAKSNLQSSECTKSLSTAGTTDENHLNDINSPTNINARLNDVSANTSSPENKKCSTRSAARATLAKDAKLVKLSLPTKQINLMQSNAQFLNKGRNFLNFITEKSTNIMEKTLLPQNLAVKYNSILKLTDTNQAHDKKHVEESCTGTEVLTTESTPVEDTDLNSVSETCNLNQFEEGLAQKNHESFLECRLSENQCAVYDAVVPRASTNGSSNIESSKDQSNRSFETVKRVNRETRNYSEVNDNAMEITSQNLNNTQDASVREEHLKVFNQSSSEIIGSSDYVEPACSTDGDRDSAGTITNLKFESLKKISNGKHRITYDTEDNDNVDIENTKETIPEVQNENLFNKNTESSSNFSHREPVSNESTPRKDSKNSFSGLLEHPAYITLLRDYTSLKGENQKFCEVIEKLEKENQRLESENSGELYAVQLETLEKTIEHLRNDLRQATTKRETLSKEYTAANKERESMVMKYAVSEKQLIDTQRAREYAERKAKDALKEQELLQNKLKQVQGERTRICNILDSKCHELTDAQKETERLKEDLNMREVKLKWTQNKLKTEMEAQKETQQKLEKAMVRINEMKEECEQVHKESQEMIRKFQQSEENKAVTLDQQLKEQQARLILERHVTEDKEMSRLQLQKEVDLLKQRQQVLIEENNALSLKVQDLGKERLNYESNLSNLKIMADRRQKEVVDLVGKVSQFETLKLQLKHKEECLTSNETEVERLRQSNNELLADMEACRLREAHMLDFTQKLTDKNVRLQSEFTSIEARAEQLEMEQGPMRERIVELTSKVKILEESLAYEKSKRTEECGLLARHVAEQTQLARNLTQKLEDSQGENAVLRRKQQISLREMTRELQQCRKRLETFEAASPSNSLDPTSRTGSSTSLNTGDTLNGAVSDNSNSGDHALQLGEPDRQTLIDRIVKLQRINVRRAEKLDFLEEHTRTLVEELRKKTKIIQHYIMHENPDAMGSNERDRNKAELARHGGIMASVYNHRVSDGNMTLELSLEITQKLQAVLEDTLLKNITLKDSIDTLGGEIARLTMQNKQRQ